MNKKKTLIVGIILLISIFLIMLLFFISKYNLNDTDYTNVVLKENVVIITDETEDELIPHNVTENTLSFAKNPKYAIGTVIVSGITEASPSGYIKRVVKIDNKNGETILTTEPATFLDVFEKLHFSSTIELAENESTNHSRGLMQNTLNISPNLLLKATIMPVANTTSSNTNNKTSTERKNLFKVEFDEKTDDFIQLKGSAEAKVWLELKIDIENDNIELLLTANDEVNGNVFVGYQASCDKNLEKEIFSKQLPSIQIMAGPVPIVITNDITAKLECEADVSGEIGINLEIKKTSKNGFIYSSKDTSVKEINEKEFTSGGVGCTTGAKAKGSAKAGIGIYLTTLFYDCSGAEMVLGVEGEAEGEITVDNNTLNTDNKYYGKLLLSISPNIAGNIIVQIPVIDDDLYEMEIFKVELEPFWENIWENTTKEIIVGQSNNIYKNLCETQRVHRNKYTAPIFSFYYPDNWSIYEQIDNEPREEIISIKNNRGVVIRFVESNSSRGLADANYGGGYRLQEAKITEVEKSAFKPNWIQGSDYSYLGEFVVAKVVVYGYYDMLSENSRFVKYNGSTYFTVVPKTYITNYNGTIQFKAFGYWDSLSWEYPAPVAIIATSPDGEFTKKEEEEIINILSTFEQKIIY